VVRPHLSDLAELHRVEFFAKTSQLVGNLRGPGSTASQLLLTFVSVSVIQRLSC
jgi:hypothetical protein